MRMPKPRPAPSARCSTDRCAIRRPFCAAAYEGSMASTMTIAATRERTPMQFLLATRGAPRYLFRALAMSLPPAMGSAEVHCPRDLGWTARSTVCRPRTRNRASRTGRQASIARAGCATRRARLRHIHENLRESPAPHRPRRAARSLRRRERPRFDFDDQRFEMGLVVQRAPSSVAAITSTAARPQTAGPGLLHPCNVECRSLPPRELDERRRRTRGCTRQPARRAAFVRASVT